MKCTKSVSDHTGFYFHPCGKTAKFIVKNRVGDEHVYCGIHARRYKDQNFEVREIPKPSNVELIGSPKASPR